MKRKIAFVIPTHYNIHSSLINLLKVYRYIMKHSDFEVTIFTDKKNDVRNIQGFKIQKVKGIDYKTIWEKGLFVLGFPRFFYTDLVKKLKGYDVIETSNPEFYGFAIQSYIASKKYGSKLVFRTSQTVDGFFLFRLTNALMKWYYRKIYDHAHYLLFTNPQSYSRAVRLGYADKKRSSYNVIGHATDLDVFKEKKNHKKDQKTFHILSVGGLIKLKGHQLIMEAASIAQYAVDKPIHVHIVGDGPYKSTLQAKAKDLGITKNVTFHGSKGHKELVELYNKAHVFVLANDQEITPAVNEAVACKVPVVVTECGGREFVLPDESYGLVAKKHDAQDLADKISETLNRPMDAKDRVEKAHRRVKTLFSIPVVAKAIYEAMD